MSAVTTQLINRIGSVGEGSNCRLAQAVGFSGGLGGDDYPFQLLFPFFPLRLPLLFGGFLPFTRLGSHAHAVNENDIRTLLDEDVTHLLPVVVAAEIEAFVLNANLSHGYKVGLYHFLILRVRQHGMKLALEASGSGVAIEIDDA